MQTKPIIFTITGPSCAGKSTLEKLLVNELGFVNLISETTREIRPGEVNGKSYNFHTVAEYEDMIKNKLLIEHVEFNGNYYGLSVAEVEKATKEGKVIVAVVEPNGRDQIRKYASENNAVHIPIFVTSSPQTLSERFLRRVTDKLAKLNKSQIEQEVISHAKRLSIMLTEERRWVEEATSGMGTYLLMFANFNEETQDSVISSIRRLADDIIVGTNEVSAGG